MLLRNCWSFPLKYYVNIFSPLECLIISLAVMVYDTIFFLSEALKESHYYIFSVCMHYISYLNVNSNTAKKCYISHHFHTLAVLFLFMCSLF